MDIKNVEAKILNRFDNAAKHNIIIEFADLNDIPLEAVVNTAHELKKKIAFIPGPKEFTRGGAKSIASYPPPFKSDVEEFLRYHRIIGNVPDGTSLELPGAGSQFKVPVKIACDTPAAMNKEIPDPIPHLETLSSIKKD